MDELEIGGKIYISSKRASELTGYAKDYVGQLARGGKIDARRVGRAWYVLKNALIDHGSIPIKASEVEQSTAPSGIIKPKIIGHVSLLEIASRVHNVPKTWDQIKYFSEDTELFPTLKLVTPVEVPKEKNMAQINDEIPISVLRKKDVVIKPMITFASLDGVVIEKKPVVAIKVDRVEKKTGLKDLPRYHGGHSLAPAIIGLVVVFFGALWFGLSTSHNFGYEVNSNVLSAGVGFGFENLSYAFQIGTEFLTGFYHQMVASWGSFFAQGLIFISDLPSRLFEMF